ncbi:MAG: hypothetical protein V4736_02070 [Bdellovibrionota bacterium]
MKLLSALLTFVCCFAFALEAGDEIELMQFLNGRSTAQFMRKSNNIVQVLPSGTKARITSPPQKLPSGASALNIEVTDGPSKGKSFWVHYEAQRNNIKLLDKKSVPVPAAKIAVAVKVETVEDCPVIRDQKQLERQALVALQDSEKRVTRMTPAQGESAATCVDCRAHISDLSLQRISKDENPSPSQTWSCIYARVQECSEGGVEPRDYYTFSGRKDGLKSREWGFKFDKHARQDMYVSITDAVDGRFSTMQSSAIYFFPRTYLPQYKILNDEIHMILPTGEKVIYDKNNNIIGGVLAESGNPQLNQPPRVSYSGTGLTIRTNSSGVEGRGAIENMTATVSKGGQSCTVPKSQLWNSDLQFKYATDEKLDAFLKSSCGFGI